MKKNKLKIGDIARKLGIKKSIIRQWEQDFNLKTSDNQHYYSSDDLTVLKTIRDLLRTQGMSIDDAKKQLQQMLPATKYVDNKQPQSEEPPSPEPEKVAAEVPSRLQEAAPVETSKAVKKEIIIPEKKNAIIEVAPVQSQPIEKTEIKQAAEQKVDSSKDVRNQLSSLKERLLKFKKMLD